MTTLKACWKIESVYGTNAFTTPATDVGQFFGDYLKNQEIPIPWHTIEMTPVYRLGTTIPVNLVEGAKNVEFTMKFCPLGADEWKFALGDVTAGGGNPSTFKTSSTIASRTIYIETEYNEYIAILGCVVKSLDFYADKNMPTVFEIKFIAAEVVGYGPITTTANPIYHADLDITSAWGWSHSSAATLDAHNVVAENGQIERIHLHIENMLKTRITTKIVSVKKVGAAVVLDFDIQSTAVATNEIIMAIRAAEQNDFYYYWLSGALYWKLYVNNLKMRALSGSMKIDDGSPPVYTIVGTAFYDATRTDVAPAYKTAVTVLVKDGVTYS
jgi:hypothetical protein